MHSIISKTALAYALTLPAPCQTYTSSPAGDGCNGATLTVNFDQLGTNSTRMSLFAQGLHPSTLGGMVFGGTPAMIGPVLSPGCFVHTQPYWATQFMTDASGEHLWQRAWPASILGFHYVQMGTVDPVTLEVRLTNCLIVAHM